MNELPANDIIEITLIGTGGGYGESVVCHLGNRNWIVIDSCIDPRTKECLPLTYLESKGVDISQDIKLIICTHWHNDHILGISKLLEYAASATMCIARANDKTKFLQLVGLDYSKIENEESASSTTELNDCLKLINSRKSIIKKPEQDKILFSFNEIGICCEVISLSPSYFVQNEFDMEISGIMSEY
jgi:beta-lactamase superfamily II metal-dependent hydrolase